MPPPVTRTPSAPAPPPRTQRVKATWGYNEDGTESNDLVFSEGDVIEIVDETNADWWTGKCNGRQGLFPSSYVKKIEAPAASAYSPPPAWTPAMSMPFVEPNAYQPPQEKPAYKPFGAAYHGSDAPPPVGGTNSVGLQEVNQEKKKSRFGKYGNTMAQSAAGGVGFGAGAAIGGGLINAIF